MLICLKLNVLMERFLIRNQSDNWINWVFLPTSGLMASRNTVTSIGINRMTSYLWGCFRMGVGGGGWGWILRPLIAISLTKWSTLILWAAHFDCAEHLNGLCLCNHLLAALNKKHPKNHRKKLPFNWQQKKLHFSYPLHCASRSAHTYECHQLRFLIQPKAIQMNHLNYRWNTF